MHASVSLIKRSRICHTRLYNVDETQRRRTLIGRHLCGTDVHAAIDLHRVARQHFGRKTGCQTVGNIALTNRRRTDDRNGGKTCPGSNLLARLAHNGAGQIPGLGNVNVNINDLATS